MSSAAGKKYSPVFPHQPIRQIGDDLFMARGSIDLNRLLRLSRNMAVVRSGSELTLINPIRLDERGLRDLDALGTVKHVMRLGGGHGLDDPFYMDRYRPTFWCQHGGNRYSEPKIDRVLAEGGELPFDGGQLVVFGAASIPEAALVLSAGKGFLLTCDSIQHYGDFTNNNLPARLVMPLIGFSKTTLVGPVWLKNATPRGGSLRTDFRRLLELPFDAMLAAHGTLLETGAHEAVERAVERAFAA